MRANRIPKMAGIGVERYKQLLAEFDAGQTSGWQEGRITYFQKNYDEIVKFVEEFGATLAIHPDRNSLERKPTAPRTKAAIIDQQNPLIRYVGPIHVQNYDELKDRLRFKGLGLRWREKYPFLFDVDPDIDRKTFETQLVKYGTHFNEWLAALILHRLTGVYGFEEGPHQSDVGGFHALNQKYEFQSHKKKQEKLEWLCLPDAIRKFLLNRRDNGAMFPDLLMYHPEDPSKWFFCEAKGRGDGWSARRRLTGKQGAFFERLAIASDRPLFVLWVKDAESIAEPVSEIAPGLIVRDDELKELVDQLASVT